MNIPGTSIRNSIELASGEPGASFRFSNPSNFQQFPIVRRAHLILSAGIPLSACVWLLLRKTDCSAPPSICETAGFRQSFRSASAPPRLSGRSPAPSHPPAVAPVSHVPTSESAPLPQTSPADHTPLPAVQLADDVRLPAAVMSLADQTHGESPAAVLAKQEIVNSFYREIATRAATEQETRKQEHSKTPDAIAATSPDQDTILITPGTDTDAARQQADGLFRVIFGDSAYNQHSMLGALEVRQPEGTGGN